MNIAKEILDKYGKTVIPINNETVGFDKRKNKFFVKAKWSTESEKYQHQKIGYSENLGLWIPPDDWLVLEFEGTREQNVDWIKQTATKCETFGLEYCLCSHEKGKSPYIWICNIEGIETHEHKKILAKALVPENANLDWTNIGKTLVPVIEHRHWKHGTVHRIIEGKNPLEQRNQYPQKLLRSSEPSPSSSVMVSPSPSTPIPASLSSNNDKIKAILSSDFFVQRLLAGNIKGYDSPSHARMALYFALVGYGLSDADVHFIMSKSRGLHYHEKKHRQENDLTKARERCYRTRKIWNEQKTKIEIVDAREQ